MAGPNPNPVALNPNLEPEPRLNSNKLRIHVEHAIERLKNYKILYLINSYLRPHCDKVVQVCAVFTVLIKYNWINGRP